MPNMAHSVKKWWKDDSGSGADQHSTNFLYLVIGLAVGSTLLAGLGYIMKNKAVGIGTDISGYKVTVPNGTGNLNNVTYGNGNSTVNGANFN